MKNTLLLISPCRALRRTPRVVSAVVLAAACVWPMAGCQIPAPTGGRVQGELLEAWQGAPASQPVHFATNRIPGSYGESFDIERFWYLTGTSEMRYGTAIIANTLETKDDGVYATAEVADETYVEAEEFFTSVLASGSPHVIFFVHGGMTSMEDEVRAAAQTSLEAGADTVAVTFSWPSDFVPWLDAAETKADVSGLQLRVLLVEMLSRIAARHGRGESVPKLSLVSRGLGSRVISRALDGIRIPAGLPGKPFANIVFTAPSIDYNLARLQNRSIADLTDLYTIYTREVDLLLALIEILPNRGRMLGRPVENLSETEAAPEGAPSTFGTQWDERVDLVDASEVDGGLFGHYYALQSEQVRLDLRALLRTGQRAESRGMPRAASGYFLLLPPPEPTTQPTDGESDMTIETTETTTTEAAAEMVPTGDGAATEGGETPAADAPANEAPATETPAEESTEGSLKMEDPAPVDE